MKKNFRNTWIALGLIAAFLLFNSNFFPKQSNLKPNLGIEKTFSVKPGNFAKGRLESHYIKHGAEFGDITQQEYLERARILLSAPADGDVLEKIDPEDGDIIHFKRSTGEYAVMTPKGRIRTYFKTSYHYFMTHDGIATAK